MINIGIVGYGNLGKGVEKALQNFLDLQLVAVFTRRNPNDLQLKSKTAKVKRYEEIYAFKDNIDVMILCGGSATDLEVQMPQVAKHFCFVDSFDTHAKAWQYYLCADKVLQQSKKVGAVCVGWDPGLFSINRLYAGSILPGGSTDTFWGKGISQGHSDAIRRIDGVVDAVQYTEPVQNAIFAARSCEEKRLTNYQKHKRICFVTINENANKETIAAQIKNMPHYFAGYETEVNFISLQELRQQHGKMPHGGNVIHSACTGEKNKQLIEYSLKLDSNPEFTASVLVAYARAVKKLHDEGNFGAKTVFDIAPSYLSNMSKEEIITNLL